MPDERNNTKNEAAGCKDLVRMRSRRGEIVVVGDVLDILDSQETVTSKTHEVKVLR